MRLLVYIFLILAFPGIGIAQIADVLTPAEVSREKIMHYSEFSLSYNSSYRLSSWVAYKVTRSQINKDENSGHKFIVDPGLELPIGNKKDYKKSGYEMAQLVNYYDLKHNQKAVEESFYMSNVSPMKLAYYKHIWLKTEDLIRLWSAGTDGLYVICGPILSDSPFASFGSNNISIPKRFFKAVYDPKNKKAIGFIFRNGMSSGSLNSFVVSIDKIEEESGLDLFHSLDDEIELHIEGQLDLDSWNFELLD